MAPLSFLPSKKKPRKCPKAFFFLGGTLRTKAAAFCKKTPKWGPPDFYLEGRHPGRKAAKAEDMFTNEFIKPLSNDRPKGGNRFSGKGSCPKTAAQAVYLKPIAMILVPRSRSRSGIPAAPRSACRNSSSRRSPIWRASFAHDRARENLAKHSCRRRGPRTLGFVIGGLFGATVRLSARPLALLGEACSRLTSWPCRSPRRWRSRRSSSCGSAHLLAKAPHHRAWWCSFRSWSTSRRQYALPTAISSTSRAPTA